MTLIWVCSAWLLGIAAADWLGLPAQPCLLLAGAAALLAPLWRKSRVLMPLVLFAALALGAARMAAARPTTDASVVWSYVNRRVTLTGSITQQPVWRDDAQTVIIASEQLEIDGASRGVHGLVRLNLPSTPELFYGQRIQAIGVLKPPESGRSFDFRGYLARHSIHVVMEQPGVDVQREAGGRRPLAPLLRLNAQVRDKMLRLLPEPHAALLAGMLLGTHASIPRTVLQDFRGTGTSHLLVISGWNITVLAGTIVGVFVALGFTRREGAVLTLPVLFAYVLFVGASPSVMRAGIMGTLVLWAEVADRESDAWTGLLLACALLALLDPNVLWDIGFQLSVLGTAGMIAWARPLRTGLTGWSPLRSRIVAAPVEALAATLAGLTLILPVVLYYFGDLTLVAPLANMVVAPAVPFAMLFGSIAAVVALIWLQAGQIFALLAWPFTAWLLGSTRLFASFPAATVHVASFPAWGIWVWYGAIAGLAWWHYRRRRPRPAPTAGQTPSG